MIASKRHNGDDRSKYEGCRSRCRSRHGQHRRLRRRSSGGSGGGAAAAGRLRR